MVSRRPNDAERGAVFACEHAIDRVACRAGCQPSNVEGRRTNDSIRIGPPTAPLCEVVDGIDVCCLMDAFDPLQCRLLPRRSRASIGEPRRIQAKSDLPNPFGPLRMSPAGIMVEKSRIGIKQRHNAYT